MYHWYFLINNKLPGPELNNREELLCLRNDNEYLFPEDIDKKLFWLGFFEVLPIVMGLIASKNFRFFLFRFDYALIGVIISIIIIYIFKDDVPHQPINAGEVEKKVKW